MPYRRTVLKALISFFAGLPWRASAHAGAQHEHARMLALAEVVLPTALGVAGRQRAVDAFVLWLRDYRAAAELDHGYGLTRLMQAAANPARNHAAHFADLDRRCGAHFSSVPVAARQAAVTQALLNANATTLPALADGAHVATDLMAHFFNGPEANDQVMGRSIGRFSCRGLQGSEQPPPLLPAGESS